MKEGYEGVYISRTCFPDGFWLGINNFSFIITTIFTFCFVGLIF